ncbi:MAG: hypothetical protein AB7U95_26865, partial [Reyranella sp.]
MSSPSACAGVSDEGGFAAGDRAPVESAAADPAWPTRIALESIAATLRKFDRKRAGFGADGRYVVILPAPWFGHWLLNWVRAAAGRAKRSKHHMRKSRDVTPS